MLRWWSWRWPGSGVRRILLPNQQKRRQRVVPMLQCQQSNWRCRQQQFRWRNFEWSGLKFPPQSSCAWFFTVGDESFLCMACGLCLLGFVDCLCWQVRYCCHSSTAPPSFKIYQWYKWRSSTSKFHWFIMICTTYKTFILCLVGRSLHCLQISNIGISKVKLILWEAKFDSSLKTLGNYNTPVVGVSHSPWYISNKTLLWNFCGHDKDKCCCCQNTVIYKEM